MAKVFQFVGRALCCRQAERPPYKENLPKLKDLVAIAPPRAIPQNERSGRSFGSLHSLRMTEF